MTDTRTDTLPAATQSALIVPVPETERVVGRHRRLLDRAASWGVPAHVTVLYPFIPPNQVTTNTLEDLRAALAGVSAFDCVFSRIQWFEDDVVWLEPEPDRHFRALTRAVWARFPDHPPYGGKHLDPVPHLTIGDTQIADLESMERAAVDVEAALPVTARLDRVLLIAGKEAPGSWRTVAEFTLPTNQPDERDSGHS